MTVREVVEHVMTDLGNISIPVAQTQSIGIPIMQAIQNLGAVIKAWDEEDRKNQEEQPAEEPEIKLEVVPADEVPEDLEQ